MAWSMRKDNMVCFRISKVVGRSTSDDSLNASLSEGGEQAHFFVFFNFCLSLTFTNQGGTFEIPKRG